MPTNNSTNQSVAITDTPLISVAIADRDGMVRSGIASFLASIGTYDVIMEAENDEELLGLFDKSKHLPLICIICVNALDNNYEAVRRIKYDYPKVKILILGESFSRYTILNMLRNEVNGFLLKKESAKELNNALMEIHTRNYYYSSVAPKELFLSVKYKEVRVPDITKKQQKFMTLISSNLSYSEIATRLDVGVRTIDGYRDLLFEKFKLENRTDLVLFALKAGLVRLDETESTDIDIIPYKDIQQ